MRPKLVFLLSAAWLAANIASFVQPRFIDPTGDSFTRGLNRLVAVMGWQALALLLAIVAVTVLLRIAKPRNWALYVAGYGPILVSGLTLLLVVSTVVWARFSKPDPISPPPPGAITEPIAKPPLQPTTTN